MDGVESRHASSQFGSGRARGFARMRPIPRSNLQRCPCQLSFVAQGQAHGSPRPKQELKSRIGSGL